MKVFQSLNCIVCKLPFARKAREARSPRHLYCGLAMCHECFEEERRLEKEERKHQCNMDDFYGNLNFAFFLIDILSQENSVTLSPFGDGYLLAEPFNVPECIICHDEFSNTIEEKKSRTLYCNHIICMECYMRNREPNNDFWEENWPYKYFCPSCNSETWVRAEQKNQFQAFLDELPEITRQLEELREIKERLGCVCDGCEETGSKDKMYYCNGCTSKICAVCVVENHRLHETTPLFKKEAPEVFDALREDSTRVVKTYEDLFPEMHTGIMEDISVFKTKLALKEENDGKSVLKFEGLKRKLEECTKLKKDFEASSEELVPHLRRYETKVKRLIETLDKDLS